MKKKIRFAPFIRVSTEKTKLKGESLNLQKSAIESFVKNYGGIIPKNCWSYCGNEHATPTYEHKMLERLLNDSGKNKFDAIIVYEHSRWSRDNLSSKQGLEILKKNGIKFFTCAMEYDLFDPSQNLLLGVSVETSEYQALMMQLSSIQSRIKRASEGKPASRPLPSGRLFDKANNKWSVDKKFKDQIQWAAKSFIKGSSLGSLSKTLGMSRSNLRRIFLEKAGSDYKQRLRNPKLNIDETVVTKIPPLLNDNVISAIRAKFQMNKTIGHGQHVYQYLLGRMVICEKCKYAFVGCHDNKSGIRYYRHSKRGCKDLSRKSVSAERLENVVFLHIYSLFGDKEAIKKAVLSAVPNSNELDTLMVQKAQFSKELKSISIKKEHIFDMIEGGTISSEDVKKRIGKHKEREALIKEEIDSISSKLENIPSKDELDKIGKQLIGFKRRYFKKLSYMNKMTFDDKRKLLQSLLSGKTLDGERLGVYLKGDKNWVYVLKGNFVNAVGGVPPAKSELDHAKAILGFGEDDNVADLNNYLKAEGTFPDPVR